MTLLKKVHLVDTTMFYAMEGGGVRTYLLAKAKWLRQRSQIRHSLVSSALRTQDDADFIAVRSAPVPAIGGYRMPLSIASTARTLQRLQPSLIEAGDPYQFAWAAIRVKRAVGVPIVGFYHSDVPRVIGHRLGDRARIAAQTYLRTVYRRFDLVLAPSRRMVDFLRGIGVERVLHQPLGVDTDLFAPMHREPRLRARLGLPPETRLLVYAGRFTHEKKLPLLVDALHMLGTPYHLLLIGGGATVPDSAQISRLPFQHDSRTLSGLIGGCDLLVHPGDQETFGLVVLEAMASGVPVLGVADGGVSELVDRHSGLLVAPRCSVALAEGIRTLYREDLRKLGRQARERVCAQYDWNLIVPQIMRQYGRLFAGHQRAELEARIAYRCQ